MPHAHTRARGQSGFSRLSDSNNKKPLFEVIGCNTDAVLYSATVEQGGGRPDPTAKESDFDWNDNSSDFNWDED